MLENYKLFVELIIAVNYTCFDLVINICIESSQVLLIYTGKNVSLN